MLVLLAARATTLAADAMDINLFAQYGVLGIIAALLIWFAKGAHQRERERADRIEADNKRLNEVFLERVIPILISSTRTLEEVTELLNAIQRERQLAQITEQQRQAMKGGG